MIEPKIDRDKVVLLYFRADWCPICKAMERVVNELATQYAGKLEILTIDAEESYPVAREYQVRALPTFVLLVRGQTRMRLEGLRTRAELARHIRLYIH